LRNDHRFKPKKVAITRGITAHLSTFLGFVDIHLKI